jgi:hypothetical protein
MGILTPKRAVLFVVAVLIGASAFGSNPSPRTQARLVWDTPNNVGVLFGGLGPTDPATVLQHDSAETWLWNGSRWVQRFPETTPPARAVHAMVWDSRRNRAVMFGGRVSPTDREDPPTFLNDTWIYQNENWTPVQTAEVPPVRQSAAIAYDRARDKVVLYGGNVLAADEESFELRDDTWEFDGLQWKRVATGSNPKVAKPILEYDATRNQLLLVGLNETGTAKVMYRYASADEAWVALTPATMPTCVNDGHMVYREDTEKVLFFGGVCATGTPALEEGFEWDGSNWTKITFATFGRLAGQAVAYDPLRREVVAFAGSTALGSVVGSQTSILRGLTWRVALLSVRPAPRSQQGFVTDAATNTIWMFGGLDETSTFYYNDFWGYRNGQWFQQLRGPATCVSPLAAYDTDRARLVVTCTGEEVHEWDGTAWKTFTTDKKPNRRSFAAMAYDPTLKKTVMYGGYFGNDYRNDTWTWNGTAWTEVKSGNGKRPPNRGQMAMWYDPLQKRVIVYGGIGRNNINERITRYSDMWAFTGTEWTKLNVTETPGMRFGAQVGVNPVSGKVLLFGGLRAVPREDDPTGKVLRQFFANDTWEWDGAASRWAQKTPNTAPDPDTRENGALAWDPVASQFVLFAGYADGFYRSDTWEWTGEDWTPRLEHAGRRRAVR